MDHKALRDYLLLGLVAFASMLSIDAHALSAHEIKHTPLIQQFIQEMESDYQFSEHDVVSILQKAEVRSDILENIGKPSESKPWNIYAKNFLIPERINKGFAFTESHHDALTEAEKLYGVPPHVITAILGVETLYGHNQGRYRVADALATLAFYYPPRSNFFFDEFKHFLIMCREDHLNPLTIKGSYAGAMGQAQFMPSSYRNYAIDFDGNHEVDLMNNTTHAISSIGNYLKSHGWQSHQPVAVLADIESEHARKILANAKQKHSLTIREWNQLGVTPTETVPQHAKARLLTLQADQGKEHWLVFHNFDVILTYNRSPLYAMAVYQLSHQIHQHKGEEQS